jgi:gluconolactonase
VSIPLERDQVVPEIHITGSGIPPPIFLEGPTTDVQGNLFVVDVGQGRVLQCRLASEEWSLVLDYDGEPNGLALDREGRLLIADYKNGIVRLAGDIY